MEWVGTANGGGQKLANVSSLSGRRSEPGGPVGCAEAGAEARWSRVRVAAGAEYPWVERWRLCGWGPRGGWKVLLPGLG